MFNLMRQISILGGVTSDCWETLRMRLSIPGRTSRQCSMVAPGRGWLQEAVDWTDLAHPCHQHHKLLLTLDQHHLLTVPLLASRSRLRVRQRSQPGSQRSSMIILAFLPGKSSMTISGQDLLLIIFCGQADHCHLCLSPRTQDQAHMSCLMFWPGAHQSHSLDSSSTTTFHCQLSEIVKQAKMMLSHSSWMVPSSGETIYVVFLICSFNCFIFH